MSHAYAVGNIERDADGFEADGGQATEKLMAWLANAAKAVKNETFAADAASVGPLIKEVNRQRKTTRAGN